MLKKEKNETKIVFSWVENKKQNIGSIDDMEKLLYPHDSELSGQI